ncbi:MAG: hypothetical protein R3E66_20690 [bacterium]
MRYLLFVICAAAGCSFDGGTAPQGNQWEFDANADAVLDASSPATDTGLTTTNNATNNTSPDVGVVDTGSSTDVGTDSGIVVIDSGSPDQGMPDMNTPDSSTGGACQTNAECASTEVCCPQLDTSRLCTLRSDCVVGGTCTSNTDCGNGEECCTFDVGGVTGGLCAAQCIGQGGGNACTTNSDCNSGQLCCSGLGGNTCSNRCWSGGVCQVDSDCGGQKCCDLRFGDKQCFNQCF